ncbi:MAG: hypothetical protein FVQ81_04515 [Candidatus Glassbacteria bacterium]|nr:hypothetical protein [Candidatus Glassbacteria bacterium]
MIRSVIATLLSTMLLAGCTVGGVDSQLPAGPAVDPESFPVTIRFLHEGAPVPVRAYFRFNDQPFLIDSLGWRLPIVMDLHYHDHAFPMKPSIPVLDMTYRSEHHWYFLTGQATLPMLPGKYQLDVYKGVEFLPLHAEFELSGAERELEFELERWIDLAAEGWYGGDDHIHLSRQPSDDRLYLGLLEADGLSVGHFLQLQRRDQAAVQYGWGESAQARKGDYLIRSGEEQRSHFYGHNLMLGIDSLVRPVSQGLTYGLTAFADPLSAELFVDAHRLGGVVGYAHGDGGVEYSAAMIDLAHGDIDFLEVFQFGMMNSAFWYNALSCGFRIPGTAGSDFPVSLARHERWPRLIPPFGPDRMYIRVEGELKFDKWMDGIGEGNILLTNGPFVEFDVNGEVPGSEVRLPAGEGEVTISATLRHWRPVSQARLLVNGRVSRTYANGSETSWEIRDTITLERSSWLALHAVTDSSGAGDEAVELEAHTNPVYVLVDGRPVGEPEELRAAIERLEEMRAYYASDELVFRIEASRLRLLERADAALAELRRRLEQAGD